MKHFIKINDKETEILFSKQIAEKLYTLLVSCLQEAVLNISVSLNTVVNTFAFQRCKTISSVLNSLAVTSIEEKETSIGITDLKSVIAALKSRIKHCNDKLEFYQDKNDSIVVQERLASAFAKQLGFSKDTYKDYYIKEGEKLIHLYSEETQFFQSEIVRLLEKL